MNNKCKELIEKHGISEEVVEDIRNIMTAKIGNIECNLLQSARDGKITNEMAVIKMWQSFILLWETGGIEWHKMEQWFGTFCSKLFNCRVGL